MFASASPILFSLIFTPRFHTSCLSMLWACVVSDSTFFSLSTHFYLPIVVMFSSLAASSPNTNLQRHFCCIFLPILSNSQRLMSNQTKVIQGDGMAATARRLNRVIFRSSANSNFLTKYGSLFPGIGFATGYKITQVHVISMVHRVSLHRAFPLLLLSQCVCLFVCSPCVLLSRQRGSVTVSLAFGTWWCSLMS